MKDGPVVYCRNCGVRAPQDARYCPNCGTIIPEDDMAFENVKREINETPGLKASMAKWGAVGVVAGLVLPGLGSIVGGAAGAGFAYYKRNKRT